MKLSEFLSNYQEFKKEIYEDLQDGILTPDDEIQILSDEQGIILDWYYSDEVQAADLKQSDSGIPFHEQKELWHQYKNVKPNLQTISVRKFLEVISKNIEYYSKRS